MVQKSDTIQRDLSPTSGVQLGNGARGCWLAPPLHSAVRLRQNIWTQCSKNRTSSARKHVHYCSDCSSKITLLCKGLALAMEEQPRQVVEFD